ncbi:hypothetical protein KUCAC02_020245 [Chaenocephalus aceratus]|uniref:Uncharacterized protein n=1 Tax=Chaenocephalus aceratus TaxID=36190 RepID=A0ACB9VRJ3_CHAAC|nr:hypothetical protein KUCAC02_020245 [Chaenocephalus aceratus]
MGSIKLCLLLLLGTSTLAQQDVGSVEEQSPVCPLAKRFKNFRRFVYDYEAETSNGVNGATDNKSGPKVSCKVEVEVPQTCSFILRTTECSLSEISGVDTEGNAVYRPADENQAFTSAMAKNALKITVEGHLRVQLYPEDDEPVNILNIKRGIVSALIVPVMEEEKNKQMATIHGMCPTNFSVIATEDIATDVTLSRDLSQCDFFIARRQVTSPLALITGMNFPLSKMISSTQTCNYHFDNQKKHMTSGTCTEKHIFLPLSYQNEYGISTVVKQTVTLRETSKINDRIFECDENKFVELAMDLADDKSPVQTKDAVIATMQQLNTLSQTTDGEERASLFHKLVSELRGLKVDVLGSATVEMMDMSAPLAWQALAQCGTPECTSAMLKVLRTFDDAALEVDASVYALGLLHNPSSLMVKDMLAMAQYKQSKPIMYALSNAVRKLYRIEGVTPEISAVSEFMSSLLGADCAGDKDLTFLTLRVVGNMGDAMEAADPAIKNTLLKCMRQPATTLSVQLAAIQAFRLMSPTDEIRSNLQRVSQYPKGAVQKRLAAYLILMRNPQDTDIEIVKKLLNQEQNMQIKSFVTSHIYNIISSTDPETMKLGKRIVDALEDTEVATHSDYSTKSRNYKLGMANENMQAAIQGNMIFDPSSQLPREVLLETTLQVFGFDMDLWEIGMEGKGLEPTIDALFGKNGFFPDTFGKVMYWTLEKMPPKMKQEMDKWVSPMDTEGRKVPENLVREIVRNFNKLVKDLQSQESPEAMAYLKIMGAELGFIKGSELKFIADNAQMYAEIFLKSIPSKVMAKLMSNTDNELFAHYIFMDNKFIMPTAAGMPLTFALSGTFTPGAKGGIRMAPNMQELLFKPSIGVEFVTQMGVHVPEFVVSAVEMHTNIYHESTLNAKITMEQGQVKLSIPAPQGTTRVLSISNKVMIVGAGQSAVIPHTEGESSCRPLFSGVKYCTETIRATTGDKTAVPYFPLNGETKFALDIKPSDEVSEYTATIAYELLREGEEGLQKIDSLTLALRAEGSQPSEATATMKYNRNKNVFTTQIQVPDFDVEAGVKIGMTDSIAKGQSIVLEISSKNVPQLSLIGSAKLQAMTDGMMQVQLLVPSLKTDAAITATMRNADVLTLEIKSDVKLPETSSIQAVIFKYGEDQAEVQLTSNMNADTKILVPYTEAVQAWLRQLAEDVMDQQVVKTDMKVRHVINKAVEASDIWMNKISADVPYVETLRNKIANVEMPSMPENLFMNLDSNIIYKFNQERLAITVPLPLGGKSSEELRIPSMVNSPHISVPQLEIDFASREIQIPTFTIPLEYDLSLPLMGKMEAFAKLNSNYYDWEATASAGNNSEETPSYMAKFSVMAESPIKLLSFSTEGAATITDTTEGNMKLNIDGSLNTMLLDTGFNVLETIAVTERVLSTGRYNIHATSPVGLDTSLTITTQVTIDSNILSGDINTDGSLTVGSMAASTTYLHTFSVEPAKKEAKLESTLRVNSEILKVANKIKASYANEELLIESNTNMNTEPIKHTTKVSLSYKEVKLTIQSDSVTKADERMVRSQMEFSASDGQASLRIENQADDSENRAYSLLTGSLNPTGLEINADASLNIFSSLASHKATLALNQNGLTTSCTTTAQYSPMTFENVFHGGVDTSGATVSITTKGAIKDNKAELTVEGKLASKEVYLNSILKGDLFDINTLNRVNLRLNEDGLIMSNKIVGSRNEMRTENIHSLSLSLGSFTLTSKTDNFLDNRNSYMHDITVNMERFTVAVNVKNDLKIMEINLVNDAHFKAEPYNLELTGTMKIDLTASHSAELAGKVEGTLSNSALALITPSELMFDTKNKGNVKVILPLKLSGKMDLQNDMSLTLNSEMQQASWNGLARFNQYKYSHYFTMDNGDSEINILSQINGEANLDMLKEPITIPEMTVPFIGLTTPKVEDYSLWEDTGLSNLLITTQQTFDMNSKLKYMKNPEVITIDINVEPLINFINKNVKTLHKKALIHKDKAAVVLVSTYEEAKAEYEKYSIDLPKIITIPAYKVPVINVEVSSFTIPLPDSSLITMPALHVPSALSKLTLPKITLPKIQNIRIPVLGDLTYECSMKTAMVTLKTDASILNQESILVKFDASSTSEFEILNGKIEGNANLNKAGGIKMTSVLSVKHLMFEGNHESTITLSYENVDTSITNSAKITLPVLTMEVYQEITGNPEEGLVVSMSTPSAGLVALQMQTKRPAQIKARVYGRYPSEPTNDIDIFGLKMSVMNSEKLNLQTTWNMEMPYEMVLGLKKQVPAVMELVSDPAVNTYNTIYRQARSLEGSFEQAKDQGKEMFKRAIDNFAAVNPSIVMTTVTDKTILILQEYQKKVAIVLDAVVKFLRETKFQLPGYEQRLSGLEAYQELSTFIADVSEEAVQRVPEYFASMFKAVLDYVQAIEFPLPGSNHVVIGREVLDDLFVALKKIQDQVIITVRKLGEIQLEDVINKLSGFVQFTTEQSEKFLQTLKSQNVEKLLNFVSEVYDDAINSQVLADVTQQVEEARKIVVEYLQAVKAELQNIFADMSFEQLQADIQSWIDLLAKRVNTFHNNVIKTLKEKSQSIEPYVRVGDRQLEVNIPLSFSA